MLTERLRDYVRGFNVFDVPTISFNGIDFGFIVRDGFIILGPGDDAGQLLADLDEQFVDELQTAVAVRLEKEMVL